MKSSGPVDAGFQHRLKREQTLMREIEELKKQIAAKAEDQVTRHSKMFVSSRHG